jgi:hypothetical protein
MKQVNVLLAVAILICIAIVPGRAQTTAASNLGNFKIQLATSGDTIKVTCTEGCGFEKLSFVAGMNSPQGIDYNGKTDTKTSVKAGPGKDFLFTVAHTSNGMKLVGIRGVAWEDLAINCRRECRRWVDEQGLTEK